MTINDSKQMTIQLSNVQKQFATRAETYNQSASWITDPKLVAAHVELAGPPKGKGIELCCGTGVCGSALTKAGWQMTGVDITWEMLEKAKEGFNVVQANVENLPFENNSFDLAILRQALFLFDPNSALKEIKRVIKNSGSFILSQTVPFSELDEPWLKHIHFSKQAQLLNFYTTTDIEKMLLYAGFNITEMKFLSVRESITRWMDYAPELTDEKRKEICDLVANAPEDYKRIRNVEVVNGEIFEDWNWVLFKAN
jgi:ubiquinone/menaquinone biosynthesis C-methylase UbiE